MVKINFFSNRVIKNFSFLTICNFLNQIILVFSTIKIARVLGPSNFGIYSYIFIQAVLYSTIAELGLKGISIRRVARHPEKSRTVFYSSFGLQTLGLILSVIILLFYEGYFKTIEIDLQIFLIVNIFLINLWSSSEAIWQGHQRMLFPAIVNTIFSVLWLIFILLSPAAIFSVKYLYKYYVYIQILQTITLFGFTFFRKHIILGEVKLLQDMKSTLRESSYYYFNALISLPTSALSNNFLQINSTKADLGFFNTSNRLINPIKIVINIALLAIFPNISASWVHDKPFFFSKLKKGLPIIIVSFSVICFSFVMVCKEAVLVLFGIKFLAVYNIVKLQSWFVFIFSINSLIGTIWAGTDKNKLLTLWSVINTIITTPILWYGSKYGSLGISYAYLFAYFLTFPFLFFSFTKSLELSINLKKEFIIVVILFLVSSFIPIQTPLVSRLLITLFAIFSTVYLYYGALIKLKLKELIYRKKFRQ